MKHKKNKIIMACRAGSLIALSVLLLWGRGITVHALDDISDMESFDGVILSPDKTAWTTDYMDKTIERLPEGYTISTDISSTLRQLEQGEHYYAAEMEGYVPIGKWVVGWSNAQCIHHYEAQNYKGFQVNGGICEQYYNNGWYGYCADCGEKAAQMFIYGKEDTVTKITKIPSGSTYLYICPHCNGLEQGTPYIHTCKKISYNHYKIRYDKNPPEGRIVQGYMALTKHMYQNAAVYEGKLATEKGYADTKLRKNSFSCEGYLFKGWNTKSDGSGTSYADGQSIINLSSTEGEEVILYAQWEPARNTLTIDANGGKYCGEPLYYVIQESGSTYLLDSALLEPADGYQVQFEENGGSQADDIKTTKSFAYWEVSEEVQGSFQDNVYTFPTKEGAADSIKAQYNNDMFVLPESVKENETLAWWYLNADCSEDAFVGYAGDMAHVSKDTILYAKWITLLLASTEDYSVHDGVGAVDLKWDEQTEQTRVYKLYQSLDSVNWDTIYDTDDVTETAKVQEVFGVEEQGTEYIVPYTGFYMLKAYGAKGGDFDQTHAGGKGGQVSVEMWLKKGDVLTFFAGESGTGSRGGKNGNQADGGNASSAAGRGGGAATEIYLTRDGVYTPFMIAGGGSGACQDFAGQPGGGNMTQIGERAGASGTKSGGGGGAKGGQPEGTYTLTTIDNPNIEDIAFKGGWSQSYPKETQLYWNWTVPGNSAPYPTLEIDSINTYTTTGHLARRVMISGENYTEDEYHFSTEINEIPGSNKPPSHNVYQSRGDFTRKYVAEYPTNGNTNLVVSGQIRGWGEGLNGSIRFIITDADNGTLLYDETYVNGAAYRVNSETTAVWDVGAWTDFDITGSEHVKVEMQIYGGATNSYYNTAMLDTFFYGKKVLTETGMRGGTSYVNYIYGCGQVSYRKGANNGDGYASIESLKIGYSTDKQLEDVLAKDLRAPEKIKEYKVSKEDGCFHVSWEEPTDNGTDYFHKAESYEKTWRDLVLKNTSNITCNTLISGISHYLYYVDENAAGTVTSQHVYTAEAMADIEISDTPQYIHIAAVDVADNIGETISIELKETSEGEGEISPEEIEIFTKQLTIKNSEFVYKADEKLYYVKADGQTEHTLITAGFLEPIVKQDFQIDCMELHFSRNEQKEWLRTRIPYGDIGLHEELFSNDILEMELSAENNLFCRIGTSQALRKNHGAEIEVLQAFTVEHQINPFEIYPKAAVHHQTESFVSETEKDIVNGLTIIPDGAAPDITGLEQLQAIKVLDMAEEHVVLELTARDELSGLEEFYICVANQDNYMSKEFWGNADGNISLEIDKEDPLFIGEIEVSAVAVDRVGNANIIREDGLTFMLNTNLYRQRNPEEAVFKTGDGAVLEIHTRGYVERIEVYFPEEMTEKNPELNKVYEYQYPYLKNTEELQFHIPLGIEERDYDIIVKAYKNGEMLTSKAVLTLVEGNVLDELRTRIRNNG